MHSPQPVEGGGHKPSPNSPPPACYGAVKKGGEKTKTKIRTCPEAGCTGSHHQTQGTQHREPASSAGWPTPGLCPCGGQPAGRRKAVAV